VHTPTVFGIRFEPNKKFSFNPGQFISVEVPIGKRKPLRRVYSLASSPELSKKEGYELCIKRAPNGKGTSYLASIRPGETFIAHAPFGDFSYQVPSDPLRSVCFICTGSGIGPFRSIFESKAFQRNRPQRATLLFGASNQKEIIYPGRMERLGIDVIHCLSKPNKSWLGFHGRVTDYLKKLKMDWPWHTTDFYLCGNGNMLTEVRDLLRGGHGIAESAIHKEAFALTPYNKRRRPEVPDVSTQEIIRMTRKQVPSY